MLFNHADAAAHFMRRKCSILPTPLLNLCGRGAQFRAMYSITSLFAKTYEDNVSGKLSDEMYMELSHKYEVERLELKTKIFEYM